MYKVNIEELVLKKEFNRFINDFYDISSNLFLFLFIYDDQDKILKIALREKNTIFQDYAIHLNEENTRRLCSKSFAFNFQGEHLGLSFVLLQLDSNENLDITEIKKILYQNQLEKKGNKTRDIFSIKVPIPLIDTMNVVKFDNSMIKINFSLTK